MSGTPQVIEIIVLMTNVTILKICVPVKVQLNTKNKECTITIEHNAVSHDVNGTYAP